MTREELARWRFDHDLVAKELEKIERVEIAILTSLRLPTDVEAAFTALAHWPVNRQKVSAQHAALTLYWIRQVRHEIGPQNQNPAKAAYAALLAGVHAGDSYRNAVSTARVRHGAERGGVKTGKETTGRTKETDQRIVRRIRAWEQSDDLQDRYATVFDYLKEHIQVSEKTVRRAAKRNELVLTAKRPRRARHQGQ